MDPSEEAELRFIESECTTEITPCRIVPPS
jgi:hypothetical protein